VLTITVNPAGLSAGTYRGYIALTAGNTTELVPVTFDVTTQANVPAILGLANAANYSFNGQVSPGEIVTIGGTYLGPATPVTLALDSSGKVSTSLGGVTVSFNGYLAPLIYVSSTQINCVVPYEVGNSPVAVRVSYGGQTSAQTILMSVASAPGIFTLDGSGRGQGAILNASGCPNSAPECLNGPSNPAQQGGVIVIFLTGEGQTMPAGVTGLVTSLNSTGSGPLTPQPLAAPTVTVGGKTANVVFYGEAPGTISGVLQVNAIVPTGLSSGAQPLAISLGGSSAQSQVTVSVQ
jgi:uncharacterized protein (TIGR03437 family)